MAEFSADDYFSKIRKLADQNPDGIGKIFRKIPENLSKATLDNLREQGFVVLGSGKGSSKADKTIRKVWLTLGGDLYMDMSKFERVYQDLTRTVVGDTWDG